MQRLSTQSQYRLRRRAWSPPDPSQPMRIEYHRTLIADQVRNQAFHDALARVIKPGETLIFVVDLVDVA